MISRPRIAVVDSLRGLAALAVAWFHFTNGAGDFLPAGWLKASGSRGYLGVDVFFVISGFVVPLAMARRGYTLRRDAGRFVARRIIRLDPPYLVAAALSLGLWYASAMVRGFRGAWPSVTVGQVAAHVGYLNGLLGLPWLNPAFWSLAIEFQYYLCLALAFPALAHSSPRVRLVAVATLWGLALLGGPSTLVVNYLGLFGCGLACFYLSRRWVGGAGFAIMVGAMGGAAAVTQGPLPALVAIGTAVAIVALWKYGSLAGAWLGGISYSLYLVHMPIGGRVVNFGVRLPRVLPVQLAVLAAALGTSIAAAAVLHRFVEAPAQRWAALAFRRRAAESIDPAAFLVSGGETVPAPLAPSAE